MEISDLGKKRDSTIQVAKTKVLISFAVTGKLICVFVITYMEKASFLKKKKAQIFISMYSKAYIQNLVKNGYD